MIYDLFAKIWKNNKYLYQEFQNFYPQLLVKKYKNTLQIFSSDGLNKCVAKLQKKIYYLPKNNTQQTKTNHGNF